MKQLITVLAGCAGLVVGSSVAVADILNFTATIDGVQADACAGTGSPGTGTGLFTLNTSTGDVTYDITFSGLIRRREYTIRSSGPSHSCSTETSSTRFWRSLTSGEAIDPLSSGPYDGLQ